MAYGIAKSSFDISKIQPFTTPSFIENIKLFRQHTQPRTVNGVLYGHAAKALFIAQPSLSKAMAQLERELDVAFFCKQGRNVALTKAGRVFYEQVKPALGQINQALNAIECFSDKRRSPVIGCVSPAATAVFTPLLDAYRTSGNGDPKAEIRVDTSEALVSALQEGQSDLVLCTRIPDAAGGDVRVHGTASLCRRHAR